MLDTAQQHTDTCTAIALRSIQIMADGTPEDFADVVHPEFFNHEQRDEPPETRGVGPERAFGVAQWLRSAFADLRWDVHDVVAEDDLVVVHCTMAGHHVLPRPACSRPRPCRHPPPRGRAENGGLSEAVPGDHPELEVDRPERRRDRLGAELRPRRPGEPGRRSRAPGRRRPPPTPGSAAPA